MRPSRRRLRSWRILALLERCQRSTSQRYVFNLLIPPGATALSLGSAGEDLWPVIV